MRICFKHLLYVLTPSMHLMHMLEREQFSSIFALTSQVMSMVCDPVQMQPKLQQWLHINIFLVKLFDQNNPRDNSVANGYL